MRYVKMILPAVLTAGILLAVLWLLSNLVTPKDTTEEAGNYFWSEFGYEAAYGYEAEPEGVIDVFILGDSESRTSVSPMVMYHDVGITSYCCGANDTRLCDTEVMLRRILKTQSPKLIIFECNVAYAEFSVGEEVLANAGYLFPVFAWHDRWKNLRRDDFFHIPDYTSAQVCKGYYQAWVHYGAPDSLKNSYMLPDDGEEKLDSINARAVNRIAAMCRKRGIDLLMFSAPSAKNWNMRRHNTMERIAAGLNEKAKNAGTSVVYIDMNLMTDEIPINWDEDTRDRGDHLNNSGTQKVCEWLGPWLKETYGLEDHREDPACRETWTDMYEEYVDMTGGNLATGED